MTIDHRAHGRCLTCGYPAHRPGCPDDGTCHHDCPTGDECWRVRFAGPLSGVFPGDVWPDEIRA